MNRTPLRRARLDTGTQTTEPTKPQARPERIVPGEAPRPDQRADQRADHHLDPRLAKAPADRRIRMRRCELLPRVDPLDGVGGRVWTWRASRGHRQ